MKRIPTQITLLGASVLALLSTNLLAGIDEFYQTRLKLGVDAYRAKRVVEAADELRIACFGFLDQPNLLSEGLVRLVLAQQAAGLTAEVDTALSRFVEVERRFAVFTTASLEPDIRAEFEALAAKRLPQETLLSLPSLAHLVETPEQKLQKLPPAQRQSELEALARKEPANVAWPLALARDHAAAGSWKSVVTWATRALAIDKKSRAALSLRSRALVARRDHAEALADLRALPAEAFAEDPSLNADLLVCLVATKDLQGAAAMEPRIPNELRSRPDVASALEKVASRKPVKPQPGPAPLPTAAPSSVSTAPTAASEGRTVAGILEAARKLREEGKASEASRLLVAATQTHPADREIRKALLEVACLSKDWKVAAAQVPALEPLADGEEALMFYAAVALFETGSPDGAKAYLTRARSKIQPNAFVDYYSRKILGG